MNEIAVKRNKIECIFTIQIKKIVIKAFDTICVLKESKLNLNYLNRILD